MNRKFSVIKINGFKGIVLAVFIAGCLIAGFLTFPGWLCMHIWNFIAGYFSNMPLMTLTHGIILWCILALSFYAINKGNFAISFGSAVPAQPSEERIKEIIKQINEKNAQILPVMKNNDKIDEDSHNSDDKLIK